MYFCNNASEAQCTNAGGKMHCQASVMRFEVHADYFAPKILHRPAFLSGVDDSCSRTQQTRDAIRLSAAVLWPSAALVRVAFIANAYLLTKTAASAAAEVSGQGLLGCSSAKCEPICLFVQSLYFDAIVCVFNRMMPSDWHT